MTTTKENTPTSPTVPSNSPGYCNKLIAWCRTHPIKAVIVIIIVIIITLIASLIIYVAIAYIQLGGDFGNMMSGPPNGVLGGTSGN